jgi:ribosome production factor 1
MPDSGMTQRYAFRSPEKVALQEIGPRFTLKLRWVKQGIPAVQNFGAAPEALEISVGTKEASELPEETPAENDADSENKPNVPSTSNPPKDNNFLWQWKVCGTRILFGSMLTPL